MKKKNNISGYSMKHSILRVTWFTIVNIPTTLRQIFICCFVFILLYEYYLSSAVLEKNHKYLFHTISLFSKLSYSYISAFIFYILAVYLPKERKKLKLFLFLSNRITFLVTEINEIYKALNTLLNEQTPYTELLKWEDLEKELKSINPANPFNYIGTYSSFNEYFNLKWKKIKTITDELLVFYDLLPPDLINSLVLIEGKFNNYYSSERRHPTSFNSYTLVLDDLYFNGKELYKIKHERIDIPYAFRYHNNARKEHKFADEWRTKQKDK